MFEGADAVRVHKLCSVMYISESFQGQIIPPAFELQQFTLLQGLMKIFWVFLRIVFVAACRYFGKLYGFSVFTLSYLY